MIQGLFLLPWTLARVYLPPYTLTLFRCVVRNIVLEILIDVLPTKIFFWSKFGKCCIKLPCLWNTESTLAYCHWADGRVRNRIQTVAHIDEKMGRNALGSEWSKGERGLFFSNQIPYDTLCFLFCRGCWKLSSKLMLDAITILSQVLVSIIGSLLRDHIYF